MMVIIALFHCDDLQGFLCWRDWWGITLYIRKVPTPDTSTPALSPNCCETTGASTVVASILPITVSYLECCCFDSIFFGFLVWFSQFLLSGLMLPFWKSPMSCSMRTNCRCSQTSGIVRPTATGNTSRKRFLTFQNISEINIILISS